jgi:hypothetical protein
MTRQTLVTLAGVVILAMLAALWFVASCRASPVEVDADTPSERNPETIMLPRRTRVRTYDGGRTTIPPLVSQAVIERRRATVH